MHMNKVTGLLVILCYELCLSIQVPPNWILSDNSAVKNPVNIKRHQNVKSLQQSQSIPVEYFQYTAHKPQFASNIAAFHGVKNPQQHYKSYPIEPYTGQKKPVLGIPRMLNRNRASYQPYHKYVHISEEPRNLAQPMSTGYEIYHPYKSEEPALQNIYEDSTLHKIRNDLEQSKNRLQAYEQDAGKANIGDGEYLESIEKTDAKLFPQKYVPAPYEIHKPQRRPIYYKVPSQNNNRAQVLNQKIKHPWHQKNIKVTPLHYKPLKNHIHKLRHQHAMKYDDEQNEYPQVHFYENNSDPVEGYDIYEKGKQKFTQYRNNVDESVNKAVLHNRPSTYQKLELQSKESEPVEELDEFVPIKNYAQVRKTETIKHLPKKAAFDDAETYEDILNAPRLREAIKSTKAQIVYSEEGYEDSAYDHAGEHKHASDHEGHGGFLKETSKSAGLYKIPTVIGNYQEGIGSEYRDNIEHGKKWKNKNENNEEEAEDFSGNEYNEHDGANIYDHNSKSGNRSKREGEKNEDYDEDVALKNTYVKIYKNTPPKVESVIGKKNNDHELETKEIKFEVPIINLNTTYLTEDEILKLSKQKTILNDDYIREKYPYYYKNLKTINKDSPLKYAENLKFIPKKTGGGTEFYDSRSMLECPEIDENIDPVPENLKNGENPSEKDDEEETENFGNYRNDTEARKQARLDGLGDKIDCLKAKYFGHNPLDSPFFDEEIISNPEPIILPKHYLPKWFRKNTQRSKWNSIIDKSLNSEVSPTIKVMNTLDKSNTNMTPIQEYLSDSPETKLHIPLATLATKNIQQSNTYFNKYSNNKNDLLNIIDEFKSPTNSLNISKGDSNLTYQLLQHKDKVNNLQLKLRKKRATPFIYEPYKIIRDSQFQDSKKTTTTSNVSPLIRQLQTSRVVDRVAKPNYSDNRLNIGSRVYVDIGKSDRKTLKINPTIVDISVDHRRGEPRYEIRPNNHKMEYTPVENKRAMSREDYKIYTTTEKVNDNTKKRSHINLTTTRGQQRFSHSATVHPGQKASASNIVKKTVTSKSPTALPKEIKKKNEDPDDDSEESDIEYVDDEEEDQSDEAINPKMTTTTTAKPSFRKRIRVSTTAENIEKHIDETQPEHLKLVTRFRNYMPNENQGKVFHVTEPSAIRNRNVKDHNDMPKYSEKKKKILESTYMTDTKKYGDTIDKSKTDEEEIDALIGVKHNMNDYMPLYEKEQNKKYIKEEDNDDDDDEKSEIFDIDSESDDEDDEEEDEDDTDYEADDDDVEEEANRSDINVTTPEPTTRTLLRTTDAPLPTVASHIKSTITPLLELKSEFKPIITRKKIEIHKELPINASSPHFTQFKQDIKELEIIKEMPPLKKKLQKTKPLELYKDDKLAKDINKLEDVEVFGEEIDIEKGPRHGGNFRKASKEDLKLLNLQIQDSSTVEPVKDVEASQSENRKRVELEEYIPKDVHRLHGGNLKSLSDIKRTRNPVRNAKFIETSRAPKGEIHAGNLKIDNTRSGKRRSEKLTELDNDHQDYDSSHDDDYKSLPHNSRHDRLHGGNYRSEKLVAEEEKNPEREARRSATVLLNNFVKAVPVLTTTPGYILDPSKRMYYYVDV